MTDLVQQLNIINELADVSGKVIYQYFRQPNIEIETKHFDRSSIVTIADRAAEEAMVEVLRQKASSDGIIREEGDNIPSQNGRYWVLDPIDGTSSFVKGLPIFGTLIGFIDEAYNVPLLGCMNQPILQKRWLGIHGKIPTLNRRLVKNLYAQLTDSHLKDACLASTTPMMFVTKRQQMIAAKLQDVCKRIAFGGDCYNYVSLASGWSSMPMVILESDLKYYDFCALIPIIEGAGCIITDWSGNSLNRQSTEVLATSNQTLHEQALAVINRK
ncbi:MAG: inositol monophosphatase family protein [cyanobacterium endosymbiont of Rhopalodia yunnanensis]